ncbi:unnamed protein product [Symbiodinium pilosum]|uniref:Rad21/Rec8-like protein N-terminal domain-containing protein n=1 Tax=Symbiodinium pilosum TaxID=2952 RepID=A0A812NFA0_SYMPI|nr:unnamed protein product [Symbiodinium pilosum]
MDFVSLVKQGGLLWKAWVACHFERRLKRQDYLSADVKSTCGFLLENMGGIPLRCLGHLMLGILRILLRQAEDLENKADEVRTSLLTSLSSGPGLPTVPTLAASAVTLRNLEQVQPLDFGGGGLDVLMEELPEMEVEASLEEGRRHVAPLALITLSPEPSSSAKRPAVDPADDEFGAPSAEDLASLAVMGQAAMAQIHAEEIGSPPRDPKPARDQAEVMEGSAGRESLPPIDFLLGAASSPSEASPLRNIVIQAEGSFPGEDLAAAAEAAALEAEAYAEEAEEAAREAEAAARCLQELGPMPVEFLLRDAEVEDATMQPLFPPLAEAEEACLDLMPRVVEEAVAEVEEPKQKRRRKRIWLDEKATQIPEKKYEDKRKITLANPLEYGLLLPHRSPTVGLTTIFGDLCPLLCAPLRRAAEIGARQRRAKAEDANLPSPPKPAPLGRQMELNLQLPDQELPEVSVPEVPMPEIPVPLQAVESSTESEEPRQASAASQLAPLPSPAPLPGGEEQLAELQVEEVGPAISREDVPPELSELPAEDVTTGSPQVAAAARESVEAPLPEAACEPEPTSELPRPLQDEEMPNAIGDKVQTPEAVAKPADEEAADAASLPPAKRQAHERPGGQLVPIKVIAPEVTEVTEVKAEEDAEIDLDKVSSKQGRELRASLPEDASLSFLDMCDLDHCSAEDAACRFVDLLALHMNCAVSLQQDEPYADIAIFRGNVWEAWGDESRRGAKRESLEPAGS